MSRFKIKNKNLTSYFYKLCCFLYLSNLISDVFLGCVCPIKLQSFLDLGGHIRAGPFAEILKPGKIYYSIGSQISFKQKLFDQASATLPMLYVHRAIKLGRSSFDLAHLLYVDVNPDSDQYVHPRKEDLLVERIFRIVSIDPQ